MKKNTFAAIVAVLLALSAYAQPLLQANTQQITFGTINETQTDSAQLTFTNPTATDIFIDEFKFFNDIYNSQPFATSTPTLNVPAGSTATVWVRFKPTQNVAHSTRLIANNNSGRGPIKIDLLGQGRYQNSYYSTTENLSGEALRIALTTRTGQGFVPLTYAGARDQLFMMVDNQPTGGQNSLSCVYTGRVITGWADRTAAQALNFNTEHTFPQSMFNNGEEPMRSDIHHLFAVDETANSVRSNTQFAALTSWTWTSAQINGYSAPLSKNGPGGFEPRDLHKGKGARAMLYFAMRYKGNPVVSTTYLVAQEATLYAWNNQYPPIAQEKLRNNRIFNAQGNRNPFIDYPQLLNRLKSIANNADLTPTPIADRSESELQFNNVPAAGVIYDFFVVNSGNALLNITNQGISGANATQFQLLTNPATVIVAPNTTHKIQVKCLPTTTQPITAYLDYTTGTTAQKVRLLANGAVSTQNITNNYALKISPNPVQNIASLALPFDVQQLPKMHAYNALGQSVNIGYQLSTTNQLLINTQELPQGIYTITMFFEEKNARCTANFVK
jgi:hypothetical protein